MNKSHEERWQQRLAMFGLALNRLNEASERQCYSNLERAGLVKTFEFCFELSWKVLKDLLTYEGFIEPGPRSTIRKSLELQILNQQDCELLLEALEKRNILSHVYQADIAEDTVLLIKDRYRPVFERLFQMLSTRSNQ